MKSAFEIRPLTPEDLPILTIAAAQGVDLTPMTGGERFLGWGHTKFGFAPIAIVDVNETPYVVEPHITWFPWATIREKYEALKWYLASMDKTVFFIVLKEHSGFYEQLTKRRFLRKIGVLFVPKEAGEEIHMYQKVTE